MHILIINQGCHPDESAAAQYVTDFARDTAAAGHEVTVVCSTRNYECSVPAYPKTGTDGGVRIRRLWQTGFPKAGLAGRMANTATWNMTLAWHLLFSFRSRPDRVLVTTTPPLAATVVACWCAMRRLRFVYWVMDVQPDIAVAAGLFRRNSIPAVLARTLNSAALRAAYRVIVPDKYMEQHPTVNRVCAKKTGTVPFWPLQPLVRPDTHTGAAFRKKHGWQNRFVVMYCGNHGVCHPLDTILDAIVQMQSDPSLVFVFIGTGARKAQVAAVAQKVRPGSMVLLPFQPRAILGEVLAAADLHLVSYGNQYAGMGHPSRIYGILASGQPFVYVGPEASHITDSITASGCGIRVEQGDTNRLADAITAYMTMRKEQRLAEGLRGYEFVQANHCRSKHVKELIDLVTGP